MSVVNQVWKDLRARKLWPVALGLLVAIVAVPVVLSGSSSAPAVPPVSVPASPVTAGLPAVSSTAVPTSSAPGGPSRNPFGPAGGAGSSGPASTQTATPVPVSGQATPAATTGTTQGSSPTGGGSSSSTTPSTSGPTPSLPPTIPTPKPRPTTPALTPVQSYAVSLALTNSSGGLDTLAPLKRLSPLPSARRPLLVELGVLRGGSRVLFAVQPGTVVNGPGTCIPGPIRCELLSLAQAQTEKLSVRSTSGTVEVALFAVSGIRVVRHSSRSAAQTARRAESAAGRRVLNHSSLGALSLFRYAPDVGAVVDLRNLTLRGM